MRRAAALLALVAGSCASEPPGEPTPAAFAGEEARLETWYAFAVQDGKLHPHPQMTEVRRLLEEMAGPFDALEDTGLAPTQTKKLRSDFTRVMGALLGRMGGDPYGGPGRLVLGLFRPGEDGRAADAAFLEFSALKPGEKERTVRAADIFGAYHRPVAEVLARLEGGRVRVRRTAPDRMEFHVAAIFGTPDSEDRFHLVTRVDVPLHVGRR